MGDVSGTLRKFSFEGVTFRAAMDVDVNLQISAYENEGIPSTGKSMLKKTLRNPNAEGIGLLLNPQEQDVMREFSERTETGTMSMELADGSVYRTSGWIEFPGVQTAENRAEITVIPDRALNAWQLFGA